MKKLWYEELEVAVYAQKCDQLLSYRKSSYVFVSAESHIVININENRRAETIQTINF